MTDKVIAPQLFKSADVSELDKFINDPAWALEQKVDGMRCMAILEGGRGKPTTVTFRTRGGKLLESAAAKLHFEWLREKLKVLGEYDQRYHSFKTTLDGELLTDSSQYVLFDMPERIINGLHSVEPKHPLGYRFALLAATYADHGLNQGGGPQTVRLIAHESGTVSKRLLAERVRDGGGEGLIAKRLDSEYSVGERVKHSLKLKFTSTADVIVLAKNSGESKHSKRGGDKINYEFGVYETVQTPGGMFTTIVHIGNCSGIGKDDAEVGQVIEVEYLYAGAGGKLVQPRMIGVRDDKPPQECWMNQLRHVNKEVL